MNNIELKISLYENLKNLTPRQFKLVYGMLVHYWQHYKYFISPENFLSLWLLINDLCCEYDESFPSPYDDRQKLLRFCKTHPYYFIDRLPIELLAKLFSEYLNDRIDIFINFIQILSKADLKSAYAYINDALNLNESINELSYSAEEHVNTFL